MHAIRLWKRRKLSVSGHHQTRVVLIGALVVTSLLALPSFASAAGVYGVDFQNGQGCGLFAASSTPNFESTVCGGQYLEIGGPSHGDPASGTEDNISTTAPAGIAIASVVTNYQLVGVGRNGWSAGDFYTGGSDSWDPGAHSSPITTSGISADEWGFQLTCSGGAGCGQIVDGGAIIDEPGEVSVNSIEFLAAESRAPSLAPVPEALYGRSSYVWNPPGDPWPVGASAADPSGTCNITAFANGTPITLENQAANEYAWQQCANGTWSQPLDTRQYVAAAGPLALSLAATNAAGNTSTISSTVQVDNDPVAVSLATPNDANPTVWVNHAVNVTAAATAGPSGIGSIHCAVDGGTSSAYPAGGLAVDGDGTHAVSCTAANNAVDPQGAPDTGAATQTIRIDEAPPRISFAPGDPQNPTQVVADAPDGESGLGSGSIAIQGPHASSPTPLSTTVGASTLSADIDDQGRNGDYTVIAKACDNVGNCASSSEVLHFPLRVGSDSVLSFARIRTPPATVRRRVRVGFHYRIVHRRIRVGFRYRTVIRRRHGHRVRVRVKVGGHYKRVRRRVRVGGHYIHVAVRIRASHSCGHRRVRISRHHWREITSCRVLKPRVVTQRRIGFGRKAQLHGVLITAQGVPVAHAAVHVLTRPDERGGRFRLALVATTNGVGRWSARLPGGPSRTVKVYYPGSGLLEPATAAARLTVPARIRLSISPRVLPWAGAIRLRGHLAGRYVPHDGVALRLLVRYPHTHQPTVLLALRTNRHGEFDFRWSYHAGRGVAAYPFRIATTSTETDYPYASGSSPALKVTFGRATPRRHRRRDHRRRSPHRH